MIRLDSVSKAFGDVRALDGVVCAINAASLVAIVGANGSGKTTLLRLIAGVIAPESGSVRVHGVDPRATSTRRDARFGYAGQHVALDPEMTGAETLRLFHALRGLASSSRSECIASLVAMYDLA
ncbi:MAG: ATP-binding cassette domain-containing protein, partial [bacterium]|nr:ATP-binding cassette domain-containing protein [Candidatus Kapabacteria bacterium]